MDSKEIISLLEKAKVSKKDAKRIINITDNTEIEIEENGEVFNDFRRITDIQDEDIIYKIIGMFTDLPKDVTLEHIEMYFSGIPLNKNDIGLNVGGHTITQRDVDNGVLRYVIDEDDIGKVIGGVKITKNMKHKTPVGIKADIIDVGKKLGGITIKRNDVGKYLEGVRMTVDDVGKTIGGIKISSKDVGKSKKVYIKKADIGKTLGNKKITEDMVNTYITVDKIKKQDVDETFGGYLLESIFIDNSLGGINFYQSGFDCPVYISNKYNFEIILETMRNEVDATEGSITCNRCGSTETISYQKQTRSSDEPMTTFWSCVKCPGKGQIGG